MTQVSPESAADSGLIPVRVNYFFVFHLVGFIVEVLGEGAEFLLGLYVFGAIGNVATLCGATAE